MKRDHAKRCRACGRDKPVAAFPKTHTGVSRYCRVCCPVAERVLKVSERRRRYA